MQIMGVFLGIHLIQMLPAFIFPLMMDGGFSGSSGGAFLLTYSVQAVIYLVLTWGLLFRSHAITAAFVQEEELPGGILSHQSPICQLWFWIALIGVSQLAGPAGVLLSQFFTQTPEIITTHTALTTAATGPPIISLILAICLILFCKLLGRLIQGVEDTD